MREVGEVSALQSTEYWKFFLQTHRSSFNSSQILRPFVLSIWVKGTCKIRVWTHPCIVAIILLFWLFLVLNVISKPSRCFCSILCKCHRSQPRWSWRSHRCCLFHKRGRYGTTRKHWIVLLIHTLVPRPFLILTTFKQEWIWYSISHHVSCATTKTW